MVASCSRRSSWIRQTNWQPLLLIAAPALATKLHTAHLIKMCHHLCVAAAVESVKCLNYSAEIQCWVSFSAELHHV